MRGKQKTQEALFSYVNIEDRIPSNHPLREIKKIADTCLRTMSDVFDTLYSQTGRRSIPPESLIKAILLQILYGIRSEIQLMEQMQYNMLFRWFVDLGLDDHVWTPEVFSTNRERLFNSEIAHQFFQTIIEEAKKINLISQDHFSVDGTLLKAWASQKSFRPKEESPQSMKDTDDFHGEKRSNETHESTTDPQARLYKKSKGSAAELCFMGHALMENRNGLAVDGEVTVAESRMERETAIEMLKRNKSLKKHVTVGADKGYDVNEFHEQCRENNVTPHVAIREDNRVNVLDGRTTRHVGYKISQTKRKLIEQIFGWIKSAANIRQVKLIGVDKINPFFLLGLSVYNLVRIQNIIVNTT
jgi:transposase